jgi:tRNA threonylcarbamoyladenosine biosynthesis protein TsaE
MLESTTHLATPEATFKLGASLARQLSAGDVVLLFGGLGAGKTLLTKGVLSGLGFDVDEVTSPSFALVNLYKTEKLDVYHIDLWRVEGEDAGNAVGLGDILDDKQALTIIEWAERLGTIDLDNNVTRIYIDGEGDEPRTIRIRYDASVSGEQ